MRFKFTLAYDGAAYEGWQAQNTPRQPPTVQGAVEAALFQLLRLPVRVTGAGRTDSGVHALGQVCHADLPEKNWDWRKRLNAVLPGDIRVVAVEAVAADFHARAHASGKTYFYNYWINSAWLSPFWRKYAWPCGGLDVDAMRAAMTGFLGRHDFASFQNAGTPIKDTVREIDAIALEYCQTEFFPPSGASLLRLTVHGSGFLKQMVRNMAGFLAAVGRCKLSPNTLPEILAATKRSALSAATAPACGLFLAKVDY